MVDIIRTAQASGTPILHAVCSATGLPSPKKGESAQLRFTLPKSTLAEIDALAREHGVTRDELVATLIGLRAAEAKPLTVPPEAAKLIREAAAVVGMDPQAFADEWLDDYKRFLAADDPEEEMAVWVSGNLRCCEFATKAEAKAARKRYADRCRSAGVEEDEIARRLAAY